MFVPIFLQSHCVLKALIEIVHMCDTQVEGNCQQDADCRNDEAVHVPSIAHDNFQGRRKQGNVENEEHKRKKSMVGYCV